MIVLVTMSFIEFDKEEKAPYYHFALNNSFPF